VTPKAGESPERASLTNAGVPATSSLLLWLAATLLLLVVYYPALRGTFVSDDLGYLVSNGWIHRLNLTDLREILDPWGGPANFTLNFAPVNLLLLALQWSLFGANPLGYHVTNIAIHALVSVLLLLLFRRTGIGPRAAFFGATLFLLHPANVEAVAWASQQKTLIALALALGALLLHPRRPALGALCFGLAILTKALAGFALPVAAFWAWAGRDEEGASPPRGGWLALWAAAFCLYAVPEFAAFRQGNEVGATLGHDVATHLRTMVALGARYVVMALTSFGVGPFHQPPLVTSFRDPWFWGGLVAGLLLGGRTFVTLRRGRVEGGFWIWAAIGYAPISQIVPFIFPLADRYLYFILPGWIGAGLLAWQEAMGRSLLAPRLRGWRLMHSPIRDRVALGFALLASTGLALRSNAQAWLWRSEAALAIAAARGSPDGISAHLWAAREAAARGDGAAVAKELRAAADHGWNDVVSLPDQVAFAPVRQDPQFQAVLVELAGRLIDDSKGIPPSSQPALLVLARAHELRGERAEQRALLKQAIAVGGPMTEGARKLLVEAERNEAAAKAREERGGSKTPN